MTKLPQPATIIGGPVSPYVRKALVVLEISCDGSGSDRAVSYTFTFGDGDVASGTSSTASHTYLDLGAASNPVTLVVQDGLGQTDSAVWTPP